MYSSSESEDDCYGDAARKLEKLINKYQDDKIGSVDLLDESAERIVTTCNLDRDFDEAVAGKAGQMFKDADVYIEDEPRKEFWLSATKRVTRSSAKNIKAEAGAGELDPRGAPARRAAPRARGGRRNPSNENTSRSRGRGRERGRLRTVPHVPVYNVGDTEEYPDQSHNQALFTKTNDDVVLVEDSDILEQNEELSVKVCWRSAEYCTFTIRKHQKLSSMFRHFAEKGNTSEDRLLFMYNDKILSPEDTPDSIQYNIAKFIEGGVVSHDLTNLHNNKQHHKDTGIQIKFQCQHSKKPLEITIQPDEKLSTAMIKCAEQMEQPLNKLKFLFDGDTIAGTMTANLLELEGGECIDVKLL